MAAVAGLAAGLAVSPWAGDPALAWPLAAVGLGSLCALLARVPRPGRAAAVWLACLCGCAVAVGIAIGIWRVQAIDAGALDLPTGTRVAVSGYVAAVPSRSQGEVSVAIETPQGRLLARAPEPVADLAPGTAVSARGTIREPADWERPRLARLGIRDLLAARSIVVGAGGRGGIAGILDGVRGRAEVALGSGTGPASANLLRGFVLGQDDRIDAATVEDFKRSGLAHLLAVSGQNVILLSLLAGVVLAALDVSLRARLLVILGIIAVYVPVAGAGPSIQRAGVMGAAGIVAALAQRPRSRVYAIALAAAVTLALDPRAAADVGWQLSFAAVIGIMAGSAPIAAVLAGEAGGWRAGLADAAALTLAATLATAPLLAHHFDAVSVVSLPANLVALPAVAPVMWLGMLAGALGQVGWIPVEPLTWLAGVFAGYIAQVAEWFAAPAWAQAGLELAAAEALLGFGALGLLTALAVRWLRRRRGLRSAGSTIRRRRRIGVALAFAVAVAVAAGWPAPPPAGVPDLRVSVLDVGQGDAILLEPAMAAPLLIDAGPPGAEVASQLERRGIERLAALAVTHPDLDHDGGAAEVIERLTVGRLLGARLSPQSLGAARARGVPVTRIAAGDRLRSGRLRLEVLWPRQAAAPAPAEANLHSLVLRARLGRFEMLLSGDAEAEAAPFAVGAVDVLKVAHHGSEDAGLERLLASADPELAVISVGSGNPYGHPAAATLAGLEAAGVPVLRTDASGEIAIEVFGDAWDVR